MRTIIGNHQVIIERDEYTGIGHVSCPNSIVPDFPCTLRDSIICKYKRKFGLVEGMMHVCRIQLKYPRLHASLEEEDLQGLKKVFGLLSEIVSLKKSLSHEQIHDPNS